MVGFILIVVIVMVAVIVFLVMSLGKKTDIPESNVVNNLLGAIMKTTTSCSFNYEENYQTLYDLAREMYTNPVKRCYGSDESVGEAFNSSLSEIIDSIYELESAISLYEFKIYYVDASDAEEEYREEKFSYRYGNCTGSVYSSVPLLIYTSSNNKEYHTANLIICMED